MKIAIVSLLVFVTSVFAFAQNPLPEMKPFVGESNLLVVRIVPGDKSAKLFLAGKKAAELDFKKDVQVLSISALDSAGGSENLAYSLSGDFYEVKTAPKHKDATIVLRAKIKGKMDKVSIPLKKN